MNFFQQLQQLVSGGVKFHFKLSAAGDGQMQFDIIPVASENKAGISLPPQALTGTGQELDEHLGGFLRTYIASVTTINQVITDAEQQLKAAEDEARKKAAEASKAKTSTKSPASKTAPTSAKPSRNPADDLTNDDDGGKEDEDSGETCAFGSNDTTSAPASGKKSSGSANGSGLNESLFL